MKPIHFLAGILLTLSGICLPGKNTGIHSTYAMAPAGWKAGVARTVITPEGPLWMGGYGSRTHESDGKLHDLWAKALALEDASGKKAVLVTLDIVGIPKKISDNIRKELNKKFGLSPAQIILNCSHTHSGPVLDDALTDVYPLNDAQSKKIADYSRQFEKKVIEVASKALQVMAPAQLYSQNGVTRFQVNRRNNNEGTLATQTELKGPGDPGVPVIKVVDGKGKVLAITFGYACHPTVLDLYQWSGDYPGFAQLELEKMYPGAVALFFQGAGADQNPLPRRTVPLARQYGKELAAAVERIMSEEMRILSPQLTTAYTEINLPIDPVLPLEELKKIASGTPNYHSRWAQRMVSAIEQKQPLPTTYPYPLQVWKLGEQPIMALGGELVVHYANALKKKYGQDLFVMGYSNDVMSYIPSSIILEEGGYEGAMAHTVYGLPGKWGKPTETLILEGMDQLAQKVDLKTK